MQNGSMCYWSSHSTLHQAVNTFFLLVLDTLLPACTETQDQTEDLRTFSFLLLSMCTAMWMCVAFYIPEDNKLFKAPYGHLIPQLFLWNFLVSLLHPPPTHTHTPFPAITYCLRQPHCWTIAYSCFQQIPLEIRISN